MQHEPNPKIIKLARNERNRNEIKSVCDWLYCEAKLSCAMQPRVLSDQILCAAVAHVPAMQLQVVLLFASLSAVLPRNAPFCACLPRAIAFLPLLARVVWPRVQAQPLQSLPLLDCELFDSTNCQHLP